MQEKCKKSARKVQKKVQEKCKKKMQKVLLKSANKNPQMQKSLCKIPLQNPHNLRRANRPLFANLINTYHTMAIPGPKFPKRASWGPYLPKYLGGLFANFGTCIKGHNRLM